MNKKYRSNGAIGALMDEYEKAIDELNGLIITISETELKETEARIPHSTLFSPSCRMSSKPEIGML